MTDLGPSLSEVQPAATFLERGAALPFTTPLLTGARIRKSQRPGFEFVVLNPSGGRGFYVLRPSGILAFCKPTVHDTMLFSRFSGSASITPASVREAALAVALEGHAGRDAIAAAAASIAADQAQCSKTYTTLATRFMEQVDTDTATAVPPAVSRDVGLRPASRNGAAPDRTVHGLSGRPVGDRFDYDQ